MHQVSAESDLYIDGVRQNFHQGIIPVCAVGVITLLWAGDRLTGVILGLQQIKQQVPAHPNIFTGYLKEGLLPAVCSITPVLARIRVG